MKFIQISDTHIVPPGDLLYGLDPADRLTACIDDINRHHADASFAILTGDLAHTGHPLAYVRLREMLAKLKIPYRLLLGNHDHRENFRAAFPDALYDENGFVQFSLDTPAGRFVGVDSNVPGAHYGALCDKRFAWLERAVKGAGGKPVYVFLHHPPFHVELKRMDQISLRDGERFGDIVNGATVRHLFFGHLHRPLSGSWRGVPFSTLPGTNHQVALDFDIDGIVPGSHEPPAYAVVFAKPDTTLVHLNSFLDRTATFNL